MEKKPSLKTINKDLKLTIKTQKEQINLLTEKLADRIAQVDRLEKIATGLQRNTLRKTKRNILAGHQLDYWQQEYMKIKQKYVSLFVTDEFERMNRNNTESPTDEGN